MTVRELRAVTKCPIFVERVDMDGAVIRKEWKPGPKDYTIRNIKICMVRPYGFVLTVELEE